MTFHSPSLSARKGVAVVGSQSVLFSQNLYQHGVTFCASPAQAGCVIIAEPGISLARSLAMQALSESRSVLFTHPGALAACGRELTRLASSQRLFIGAEATLLGHIPVQPWLGSQQAASLTGIFGSGADAILARMTHRAEDPTQAEAQLRLQPATLDDTSGKTLLARAQVLHGLWQGFGTTPTLTRQPLEAVTQADITRLRRWGMVLRFGFNLTANGIHTGPLAFASTNPLSGWQGSALSEATETPTSLLLTQAGAPLTAQLSGLMSDLSSWQTGAICRLVAAKVQKKALNTQTTHYLRASSTQRAPLLQHANIITEHLDTNGTWQAIVTTTNLQYLESASTICLPTLGQPQESEAALRLVA